MEKINSVCLPPCTPNREKKEAEIVFFLCIHGTIGYFKNYPVYYCAEEQREIDFMKCPYCKKYKELNYDLQQRR